MRDGPRPCQPTWTASARSCWRSRRPSSAPTRRRSRSSRRPFRSALIAGCSTSGEIAGTTVRDASVSVAVARFEHSDLRRAFTAISTAADSFDAGVRLAAELAGPGLRAVFVLSDGLCVNGTPLVEGLRRDLPEGVVITGGLAGDGSRFARTWILDRAAARGEPGLRHRLLRRAALRRPRLRGRLVRLRARATHHALRRATSSTSSTASRRWRSTRPTSASAPTACPAPRCCFRSRCAASARAAMRWCERSSPSTRRSSR